MRLKSVYISQYKNLKDFTLPFDGTSFIDVFVGKNGTGKSNLFEALIEIFRHLYEFDKNKPVIGFDYSIKYEIDRAETEIAWEAGKLRVNGSARTKMRDTLLPDNLLIYYSGHNTKVDESNLNYQLRLKKHLWGGKEIAHRFIHFDRGYKKLLLTILLAQSFDETISRIIKEKLDIKEIGNEFVITLKQPSIVNRNFKIDRADEKTLYWGIKGKPKDFLRRLSTCDSAGLRESGFLLKDGKKQTYTYFIDIEKFKTEFKYESVDNLIEYFNSIKIINMIDDIKLEVTLNSDQKQDINGFSDGQFQSIYLFALMEAFQDRNCITLLDEPDSFLHPEWQYEFLKQTKALSQVSKRKNHVLMSTHSPSTIAAVHKERIKNFELESSVVKVKNSEKNEIIKSLSAGLITMSEDETIMSISTYLKNTTQPVLFTEGISDEYILEQAWKKLFRDELRPFCIQNAYCCKILYALFSRDDLKKDYPDRILFALFDFDAAYHDWNGLKKERDEITDPFQGLTKKLKDADHYAMLLPVPTIDQIKKQVLNKYDKPWGKGSESHLSIELLFFKEELLGKWFAKRDMPGGGELVEFTGDKVKFALEYVPKLEEIDFEVFRPMFEFIKGKC